MYKLLSIVAFIVFFNHTFGQSPKDSDREKMNELLKQRQEQFGSYSESIDKHSGIFGNKTKRDIKNSNEILTDIVRLDNKIMELLNRKLDYRTFETTSYDFDKKEYETKFQNIMQANEKLEKRLNEQEGQNKSFMLSYKWSKVFNFILAALVLYFAFKLYRSKQASISRNSSS